MGDEITMKVGYARVSREEQHLELQVDALNKAGCEQIFTEKIKSVKDQRPQLEQALKYVRPGDTLVVWRLDRLGRSLKNLLEIMGFLEERGIEFQSLTEHLDSSSPSGKLIFHIFGALAEFEREIIRERTNAGLQAARARGRFGGRPTLQALDPKKMALAKQLHDDRSRPVQEICDTLQISKSTLYRYLRDERVVGGAHERQAA